MQNNSSTVCPVYANTAVTCVELTVLCMSYLSVLRISLQH